ncbi:MAG: hypothetical protein ACREXT_12075 [Gammaproteobacteria bacterium]
MCNTYKNALPLVALVCLICLAGAAAADSRWGNNRDGGYNGYYVPRPQAAFPTRPFFGQAYPRYPAPRQDGYRSGYRDGYGDGYDSRNYRGGRYCPPDGRRDYSGHRGYPQSSYYYPRSGVSFFYQSD